MDANCCRRAIQPVVSTSYETYPPRTSHTRTSICHAKEEATTPTMIYLCPMSQRNRLLEHIYQGRRVYTLSFIVVYVLEGPIPYQNKTPYAPTEPLMRQQNSNKTPAPKMIDPEVTHHPQKVPHPTLSSDPVPNSQANPQAIDPYSCCICAPTSTLAPTPPLPPHLTAGLPALPHAKAAPIWVLGRGLEPPTKAG